MKASSRIVGSIRKQRWVFLQAVPSDGPGSLAQPTLLDTVPLLEREGEVLLPHTGSLGYYGY